MEESDATGRVAALDVGDVWTGFAVSDETRSIARPVEVVGSVELEDFLARLVREDDVTEVVVGMPKTLSGEVGHQARRVSDRLRRLKEAFPAVRFVEWDERFTTRMSEGAPSVAKARRGRKGSGRRVRVDHIAAARMLQEYLESRGNA